VSSSETYFVFSCNSSYFVGLQIIVIGVISNNSIKKTQKYSVVVLLKSGSGVTPVVKLLGRNTSGCMLCLT